MLRKVEVDEAVVLPEVETVAAIDKTTSQSEVWHAIFLPPNSEEKHQKSVLFIFLGLWS